MSVLSEEYLAGLVDGEGSILIIKQPTHTLHLKITMTNYEVLKAVQDTFGGHLYGPYKHKGAIHKRRHWEYRAETKLALEILKKIYPFLIVKKDEASCAIEFGEYMYVWLKKQPYHNQWNPISQDELDNREIWRLALLGYRRRDLWQN
jgi:hypothetical protein